MKMRMNFVLLAFISAFFSSVTAADVRNDFIQAAKSDNHKKIVQLLDSGADLNFVDDNGKSALFWACSLGHDDLIAIQLDRGADVNIPDRYGVTALMEASREGRDGAINLLLKKRTIVKLDYANLGSILKAAKSATTQDKTAVPAGSIDIDARDRKGNTALHHAAAAGRVRTIEILFQYGANTQIKNSAGFGIIEIAHKNGKPEVVKFIESWNKSGDLFSRIVQTMADANIEEFNNLISSTQAANLQDYSGLSLLMKAASLDKAIIIEKLVKSGALIDARDSLGNTSLHYAARANTKNAVTALLKLGADSDIKNNQGLLPYDLLPEKADENIRNILRNHSEVNSKLLSAAKKGDDKLISHALESGAWINVQDAEGNTPLVEACIGNHPKSVQLLIENGANLNLANKEGDTPLLTAARDCSQEILKLLLIAGADVNKKDNLGVSALKTLFEQKLDGETKCSSSFDLVKKHLEENNSGYQLIQAAELGNTKLVEELLKNAADLDFEDEFELTPIMASAKEGHLEIVQLLVKSGANTAGSLLIASESAKVDIVKYLLSIHADSTGALSAAASAGNPELVDLLLKEKVNVNDSYSDESGYSATPLVMAAASGHLEIVKLLLASGADITFTDSEGKTALECAEKAEHKEVIDYLRQYSAGPKTKKPKEKKSSR